jgi:hypothetical protein
MELLEDRCLPSSYNIVDLGAVIPSAVNNCAAARGPVCMSPSGAGT